MKSVKNYTLIFLFDTPALQVDIEKFKLTELKKISKNIIIGDCSPALNPLINQNVSAERMHSNLFLVKMFRSKDEIKNFISCHKTDCFYFPMFDDYYSVRYIYRLFVIFKIKYGYINNLNADVGDKGIPQVVFNREKLNFKCLKKAVYNRFIRKFNKVSPARLFFYSNELSRKHYFWRGSCKLGITKEFALHSFDYDRFLSAKPYNYNRQYAVYLDVFIPYHPDFIGVSINIDAQKYYSNMNEIFNELEKKFGFSILIAAHPRANYEDKLYSFPKERIIYGKTAELVKGAEYLLGTWSTTNQMAVMANKPLFIICEEQLQKNEYFSDICNRQADFYGSKMIRNKKDVKSLKLSIDENKYANIRRNYFCADNATNPNLWLNIVEQVSKALE